MDLGAAWGLSEDDVAGILAEMRPQPGVRPPTLTPVEHDPFAGFAGAVPQTPARAARETPAWKFFAGGPAPMEPTLTEYQQGAEFEPGQTRRPNVLPWTYDAQTGQAQFAMPKVADIAGNVMGSAPAGALGAGAMRRSGLGHNGGPPMAKFPQYAERYPDVPPPVQEFDAKKGKEFLSKGESPETTAFMKERSKIQKDINAGKYEPYFDPSQRADVDPANYPPTLNTREILPKKQKTIEDKMALVTQPEAMDRLNTALDRGQALPDTHNWYFMKQLEDEFVKEYGPEVGRQMFQEKFARSMAATTGGADPRSNFLMAMYGNYLKQGGQAVPEAAWQMPHPIGGRYASGNMAQYDKAMNQNVPFGEANPKRSDFEYSFLGHSDKPVIDEQMTRAITPDRADPDRGQYGIWQEPIYRIAQERGLDPRYVQEVIWGGLKNAKEPGYTGQPMISTVNEAIERTSRLTGLSPAEVVRRGIARSEIPVYSQTPLGAAASALEAERQRQDRP